MTDTHHPAVAGFDCQLVQRPGRGTRVALRVRPTGAAPVSLEFAPNMAERLAHALHSQCLSARTNPQTSDGDLTYLADHASLRFDALTGSGVLTVSSRGMNPMQVRMSLDVLLALRTALAKVK